MGCIKILTDNDFDIVPIDFHSPRVRYGARGIIFKDDGTIAVINKKNKNEFKLCGGGIEDNELPEVAFKREVHEETGATIKNIKLLGTFEEHKSQDNFKQISYIYTADVESINFTMFTEDEINDGATLLWLPIYEALEKIKSSENNLKPSNHEGNMSVYHTKFIVRRDYEILIYYIENYMK